MTIRRRRWLKDKAWYENERGKRIGKYEATVQMMRLEETKAISVREKLHMPGGEPLSIASTPHG